MNKQVKIADIQKVKLDWDKLDKVLKEQNMSRAVLAMKIGRGVTYFSDLKKRDAAIPVDLEDFICQVLGIEKGSLVRREQYAGQTTGNAAEIVILENIYKELKEVHKLLEEVGEQGEAIWNKLNTHTVQLAKIKERVKEIGESDQEKAAKFLKDLLSDGKLLESDVLLKSEAAGIKKADLYKAKRELGVQSAVTEYGKNQKIWWIIEN